MFSKLVYWVFSKTSVGKLVDGNKTYIGFSLWLLGFLAQGLSEASQFFPDVAAFVTIKAALVGFSAQFSELLKSVGVAGVIVGMTSDKAKRAVEYSK